MKRRDFIVKTGMTAAGLLLVPTVSCQSNNDENKLRLHSDNDPFTLPELDYEYEALEPYIDQKTMKIHHSKHHGGYVKKLNMALEEHRLKGMSLEEILEAVESTSEDTDVLNNAGGHYNHRLFWKTLSPLINDELPDALSAAINRQFGSKDNFLDEYTKAAMSIFGSGWAWLSMDERNQLFISTTANQENPLMKKVVEREGTPLLGIDVWEHAYYLKYQNKRSAYIENYLKFINWKYVSQRYESLL